MHTADSAATGRLVISLDFELAWGTTFTRLETNRRALLATRAAIPRLLDLLCRYEIHCTWATVGMLFFDSKDELFEGLPSVRPQYRDKDLSNYSRLSSIGDNEDSDPLHYALSLLRQIRDCPGQEIAGHTFSHYYCLEDGQNEASFRADLIAAQAAAKRLGLTLASLVFPRNQVRGDYLSVLPEVGFRSYRGVPSSWIYSSRNRSHERSLIRAARFADNYLPLSGHHLNGSIALPSGLVNIPASMFLRPAASGCLARFDPLRYRRIAAGMTAAARTSRIYHLWWHPHNFGHEPVVNLIFLQKLLDHYQMLADVHGMRSCTMAEVASRLLPTDHPAA